MKLTKKIMLSENDMPKMWYNIMADMPNKPLPVLHPATKQPVTIDDLSPIFAKGLCEQEVSQERWIEIPDEVYNLYRIYRPTPLVRASGLEKALDTPAKIYFKNESVSPVGSHKLNSALPQAYFNKIEGTKHITTETGAGQWGSAMSIACKHFGLDLRVFMVKVSFEQKPFRRSIMNTYGATVFASPSSETEIGRKMQQQFPGTAGSLGMAISEAVEEAIKDPDTKYTLGSVLNHVMIHQSIIGLEAEKQMDIAGDYPDVVIACFGGGSNFGGIAMPFMRHNFVDGAKTRYIAAEPASCPKLSRGKFQYDFGDTEGYTPLIPMYTVGHEFEPASIHAGGLRYHGAGQIVSQLLKDGMIEVQDIPQLETFDAATLFARCEGIIPAPESSHAIAAAIREALKAKEEGKEKTILFNLSGHGLIDMVAYRQYMDGQLTNYEVPQAEIDKNLAKIAELQPK
ncbi:MAG: TrpB-like pyridoxal phosphate-dependent enzyme [Paludibacteraceae bacterium]|nr:TrpB-like pyridoxal phosphate-dependent enzyme [Paludibacteraceae bacterium]MBQ1851907.1 TrpB-like pyridoxal phosphate-dependent enzyme [Paludibacteraceae bacterium]MBQ2065566.1 TrpB-like pyridoxal phosphate-dependent enzyme [Paludibacteraceae bacterium]